MDLLERIHLAAKELGADRGIAEIAERIANETHPSLEDAYLFAQTRDNEQSVFTAAKQMQEKGLARKFLIAKGMEANGFPGYWAWHKRLSGIVGAENIAGVQMADSLNVNTLSEAQALAFYAHYMDRQHFYIAAPPFHILRAMMTAASEAVRSEQSRGRQLSIFSYTGEELPWEDMVVHSQGKLIATRAELIRHEMERIQSYQAKKDILQAGEIIAYMERRTVPNAT